MASKNPYQFMVTPGFIFFNKDLSDTEKRMYSLIISYFSTDYCTRIEDYEFAYLLDVSETTVKKALKRLIDLGFVKRKFEYLDDGTPKRLLVPEGIVNNE